jgi:hypothetical protein
MPDIWRDPSDWTFRDFEIMGGIFNELNDRLGRQLLMRGRNGSYVPDVEEMWSTGLPSWWSGGSGGGSHLMIWRMQEISREHSRRLAELEDLTGISERARRADAFRRTMQDMTGVLRDRERLDGPMPGLNPMMNEGGSNLPPNLMGSYNQPEFFHQQQPHSQFNGHGAYRHGHRGRYFDDEDVHEQGRHNYRRGRSVTMQRTLIAS